MAPDPNYDPEEDWVSDTKGGTEQYMLYPQFFDAMFELADMWWVTLPSHFCHTSVTLRATSVTLCATCLVCGSCAHPSWSHLQPHAAWVRRAPGLCGSW